ncbi:hypothetical protein KV557_10000 [Kitasatospora aureofaciens]|uniref:hypothetical protein n=1 Tax=Kitasatospora aureofaciens TaxID=1894 RepID=UPI001C462E5F|nr:hypothetical protein [Kitasatospora aureofaciens]MBV6697456.1 hypothetical protein [Kitasatospora aureofaciens]
MTDPRRDDDQRTQRLLVDIRFGTDTDSIPAEFAELIKNALTEGYAGRYDGTYPPPGHTYPEVRP